MPVLWLNRWKEGLDAENNEENSTWQCNLHQNIPALQLLNEMDKLAKP